MKILLFAPMLLAVASAQTSLSIHVYNRAEVPARVLESAIQDASRILSRAGVETVWTGYPPEDLEAVTFDFSGRSAYQRPEPDTRSYLAVSIGRGGPAYRETFGFALPDARTGVHVLIMYDRVEQLIDPKLATVSKILGTAIAHEIGHVLLGSVEHSSTGIMKARWDKTDYIRGQAGMMRFSATESEIMRGHARTRTQSDRPSRSAVARGIIPRP